MIYEEDKSTVFSIVPFLIHETKPGIYPGEFYIQPCLNDSRPERLVIGSSDHMMYIPGKKLPIRITTPSFQIAKAVVDDFLEGQLFTTPDSKPGICWVQGELTVEAFLEKFRTSIYESLRQTQKRWFIHTIQKTNDDWKKYKNSRVVTDTARFAARALGIPTPEWMTVEEVALNHLKCPACSTMNDPANCVCTGCRCILDQERYSKLQFAK